MWGAITPPILVVLNHSPDPRRWGVVSQSARGGELLNTSVQASPPKWVVLNQPNDPPMWGVVSQSARGVYIRTLVYS